MHTLYHLEFHSHLEMLFEYIKPNLFSFLVGFCFFSFSLNFWLVACSVSPILVQFHVSNRHRVTRNRWKYSVDLINISSVCSWHLPIFVCAWMFAYVRKKCFYACDGFTGVVAPSRAHSEVGDEIWEREERRRKNWKKEVNVLDWARDWHKRWRWRQRITFH